MPATWYDCTRLRQRPRWDADGGLWYISQSIPKDGSPTPSYRHKPTINFICEPLMGASIRRDGCIAGVSYPRLEDRLRIYREGIELIRVFRDYADLFTLAKYRRQVTRRGGVPLDGLFFELACEANLMPGQWKMLAIRMPDRSPIYAECLRRGQSTPETLAAE